jgi:hypothetical protein
MQIKYGMQQIIQDWFYDLEKVKNLKAQKDSLPLEFRSIAQTATSVFFIEWLIQLCCIRYLRKKPRLTYQENNKKSFMTA